MDICDRWPSYWQCTKLDEYWEFKINVTPENTLKLDKKYLGINTISRGYCLSDESCALLKKDLHVVDMALSSHVFPKFEGNSDWGHRYSKWETFFKEELPLSQPVKSKHGLLGTVDTYKFKFGTLTAKLSYVVDKDEAWLSSLYLSDDENRVSRFGTFPHFVQDSMLHVKPLDYPHQLVGRQCFCNEKSIDVDTVPCGNQFWDETEYGSKYGSTKPFRMEFAVLRAFRDVVRGKRLEKNQFGEIE